MRHPIEEAFSAKALEYDNYGAQNAAVQWARAQVRAEVQRRLTPPGRILEINAGTGEDAVYLAQQGYHLHATDLASGMVQAIQQKIQTPQLAARLTVQQLSFTQLDQLTETYQLILSNFGGLNCLNDLTQVTQLLAQRLQPQGYLIWVIMPRWCPWELVQILRGQWHTATRRLRGVTRAHVAGHYFETFYHSPRTVQRALGKSYRLVHLQSLNLFSPPAFMENFPRRFPRLFARLIQLDEHLGHRPPFNRWGDYFILTAQKQ